MKRAKISFLLLILLFPRGISLLAEDQAAAVPACSIKVTPPKANLDELILVDVSGTLNAAIVTVEVFNAGGEKRLEKTLAIDSPQWQTKFEEPGFYTFRAKAFNKDGKASVNPCEAVIHINSPPLCKLWTDCLPCYECVQKPILFDASLSSDVDGKIVKADFELKGATEKLISSFTDTELPYAWEIIFEDPGVYTVTAIVTDDFGTRSQPCTLEVEILEKRFFILAEGGPLIIPEEDWRHIALRLGILYDIIPRSLEFVLTGGGAISLSDAPSRSFFMINALINFRLRRAFLGAGGLLSTKVQDRADTSFEFVANAGYYVLDKCTSRAAIFLELRIPVAEDNPLSDLYKFMLGFRYLF